MSDPIIKTTNLSAETIKALAKALEIRFFTELHTIRYWEHKGRTTNECLSAVGMDELRRKYDAVLKEYNRLKKGFPKIVD